MKKTVYALPEDIQKRRKDDPALEKVIIEGQERNLDPTVMWAAITRMLFFREEWLMTVIKRYKDLYGDLPPEEPKPDNIIDLGKIDLNGSGDKVS